MTDIAQVKEQLRRLADEKYRRFISNLVPGTPDILGVRLPELRRLAKNLAKEDWRGFTAAADASSQEMRLLQGLVIAYTRAGFGEVLPYIEAYIPRITNWAVCDSFAGSLKIARRYPEEMWRYLCRCLTSDEPYRLRFAVVTLLSHYADVLRLQEALALLNKIRHDDYYVKMAVAWAVSVYFIRFPEQTMPFLIRNDLDDFTHNKALQKIRESVVPDTKTKTLISRLKR